jgi:peptide/nickel transport system substrate-binding protein
MTTRSPRARVASGTRLTVAVISAAASMALILAACSGGASSSAGGTSAIAVAVATAPTTFDPAKASNTADGQLLLDLAYAPLISLKADGSLGPGLATKWEYTDSTLTSLRLHLRTDAKFSDGTPVTAQAVVASIDHVRKANGPVGVYVDEITSETAINSSTVVLHLKRADPDIALLLTQRFLVGEIVGPKGLSDPTKLGTTTDGAGPYMLDAASSVASDHYTYVPNPNYWDKSAVHFKTFTVRVIANPQTALNAVKQGQVAYAGGSFASAEQAAGEGLAVHSTLSAWYGIFLWDRTGALVPALKDIRVRQALEYALDRPALTTALFGNYGVPNDQVSIKGYENEGYDPGYANHYNYDIQKAKRLLAEAGYPNGFTMTIGATQAYGNGVVMAQAVADQWAKIGVTVNIQSYPAIPDMLTPWLAKQLPGIAGYYDAQPMYIEYGQAFQPDAGTFNPFATSDPTLSALAAAAYAETDKTKLPAAWRAVTDRVMDLAWFYPISTGAAIYYTSKDLMGVDISPVSFAPDPTRFHY